MPLPMPEPSVIDLAWMGVLLDHCGIRLGTRDRRVTSDRDGASRDPENWRALATFGHPDLDGALARVTGGAEVEPLVIETVAEAENVVVSSARRADRTPPAPVTVAQLGDLGETVSAGEARDEARAEAQRAALARLNHLRKTLFVRTVRRQEAITVRLERLVHRLVAAEVARARDEGREALPSVVWEELAHDTETGWQYATNFAAQLGLVAEDLAPPHLADSGTAPRADVDHLTRHIAYGELGAIMLEWKSLQAGLE